MGKTKTKYPVDIHIEFILPMNGEGYHSKQVQFKIYSSPLKYEHIKQLYEEYLEENNIRYPTVMEYIFDDNRQQINEDFQMEIPLFLEECGGKFTILIQNQLQLFMDQINFEIQKMHQDLQQIKQRINDIPTRQEIQLIKKTSIPILHHNQSTVVPVIYQQKQIDLGVLFSEPIFDQIRKKSAATPVDFRAEIQRLHIALKSSIKPDITLKCQIATKQNLKHLIKYSKPKILHIICHGTRQGALQFQDDSRAVVGTLQMVNTNQIMQILKSVQNFLPDVVFINSCHSQYVGEIFFQMGVKYVIMIDSQDTIEDEAAQIFSQHFYRNIFSGEKVREAFKQAKERVKMKHNSFGCCCRHSSKQKHKPNCRWVEMIRKKIPNTYIIDEQQKQQIHKLFHIPSQNCKCELKNLNRHRLNCEWARQALFNINNDFRIQQNGIVRFPRNKSQLPKYLPKDQLVICCCFNYQGPSQCEGQFRLPHNQSNKFKILFGNENEKQQSIFNIAPSPYKQLIDYTAPQLMQSHEKIQYSILGRQKQIYDFMKRIKDLTQSVYIIYGRLGVGRTSFALKCVTYLIERRIFEMYFYIDLYGIKDKDIFRYKFNQITKFNYDGQIKLNQIKNKAIIIILDNADDFFELERDQLYDELKNLRQQLHKSKIIINLKSQNAQVFDIEKIHSEKFFLEPLSIQIARRLLFIKMRHLFDLTVQDSQIESLVKTSQSLRIPKMIQSVCQSFSSAKTKIKVSDIKKKLQEFKDGDASLRIIQENLNILKQKSQQSYELLLFISQFAQGISMDDFKMLSYYDKKDGKIHLPIGKNWQSSFSMLFEKFKVEDRDTQNNQISVAEENQIGIAPQLKNFHSIMNNTQKQNILQVKQNLKIIKGESYFLDEVSQNRFIVKRYIRDFIWKKHISESNYYMKHLFVGYMSVMLQIYFKWLVESKYIHEDLLEYSAISETGLFGFKNSIFNLTVNLSESMRFAQQYNSELQRIIIEHPTVFEKIKKSDPSMFITNHKQDFLNIYQKNWDLVYNYLKENKKKEEKVLIGYLQNLMIFIPTAFKIAKVQNSLLKYIISKSTSLLNKLKVYSEDKKIIALQLKLQLMRASVEIQKTDIQTLQSELEFNKQNTIKLIQKMDKSAIELLKKSWNYERNYILMYKEFINKKQSYSHNYNHKLYIQKSSKISSEKLKIMIKNFTAWYNQDWKYAQEKLAAKRNFLLSLIFLNILKNLSGNVSLHITTTSKMRKDYQKKIFQLVKDSANVFKNNDLMKLCLRAKLTALELYTWQLNQKKKTNIGHTLQFYEQLSEKQRQIVECQRIYIERKNNLIAFAQFQSEIKNLKKLLKQKLWQMSSTTLVCMRAVPITINGEDPIIQNLFRKKNKFRKQIQTIIDPTVDVCSKFQILTRDKLKEEVQNGCTILLLSANVKINNGVPNLVFEGVKMDEDLIPLNENFISQFDTSKIKILIIAGKNASLAVSQLAKIIDDPPVMISLGKKANYNELDNFKQFNQDEYLYKQNQYLKLIEKRKKAEVTFLKQFMRNLFRSQKITSKQQIVKLCIKCKQIVRDCVDVQIQYKKRQSPIQIIRMKGSYKDLSPGYQKNHNIDMKIKLENTNIVVLRRWKQTHRVFDYLTRCASANKEQEHAQPACINVFGDIGSGKTYFVQEIARILVEREKFSSGVFIIQGKILEKKYQGEFQTYFQKQSESGRIITLEDFEACADERLMLIIDDFHVIKPRSNGRFNLFMQKLIQKRVNLIIVTQQNYQNDFIKQNKKDNGIYFKRIKPVKIERLYPFEVDLIAYNILDLSNMKLLQKYQQFKRSKKNNENIRVRDIVELKNAFYGKNKQNQFELKGLGYMDQMKKMISNQV